MDAACVLSRESTTLSLANPQKGHFMALDCVSRRRSRLINKIVTVEVGAARRGRECAVLKKAPVDNRGPGNAQNGARTPCGTSASFPPFPPGDGGPEACDPNSRAGEPPTQG